MGQPVRQFEIKCSGGWHRTLINEYQCIALVGASRGG
jgi:hypothetical protein